MEGKKKITAGLMDFLINSQTLVLTVPENYRTLGGLILPLRSTKTASPLFSMSSILPNPGETFHSLAY